MRPRAEGARAMTSVRVDALLLIRGTFLPPPDPHPTFRGDTTSLLYSENKAFAGGLPVVSLFCCCRPVGFSQRDEAINQVRVHGHPQITPPLAGAYELHDVRIRNSHHSNTTQVDVVILQP